MRLFVVGDSTLAKFNDQYLYPRYGYATMLESYLDGVEVINNALSGRSSKSFVLDPEYKKTFDEIKSGDYLLIGFGHNDEKDDDFLRFSSANLALSNPNSFKYSIYNNYVIPAIKKGAIPIISTPVVRLSKTDNYSGTIIHDTKNGNYHKALLELGIEKNITVIDLTIPTLNLYKELGYKKALLHHAITSAIKKDGKLDIDIDSVDKTHLNIYGAKYVAYLFLKGILNTNLELKNHIKNLCEPKEELDLIKNPNYKYIEYNSPNLKEYRPNDNFKTIKDEIYGTAYGTFQNEFDLYAYESDNKYYVGTKGINGRTMASGDSECIVFKQIPSNLNFIISADAKIIKYNNNRQSAFGIKLRDDIYINANYKRPISSNYVAAGLITADASTNIIYSRQSTTELQKEKNVINEFYKEGDTARFLILRLGQKISVNVIFRGIEYNKDFFDFDLIKTDANYIYAGLYASNGVFVEFSNVNFEITGVAKEA